MVKQYGFLSHLSGDEVSIDTSSIVERFLSHLSGDEEYLNQASKRKAFLSHLSGDEVTAM